MAEDREHVLKYFDPERSSQYDKKIRASIPGYEALHAMTADFLRHFLPAEADILTVGAGTGMEIIMLGAVNATWRFTAVDLSADMINLCRKNVEAAGMQDRVSYHVGEIASLQTGVRFDAATSILVSHFIRTREKKVEYFRIIADRLKDKGSLITADLNGNPLSPEFGLFMQVWKEHFGLMSGISQKELEEEFTRSRSSTELVSDETLRMILAESGYTNIHHFYRAFLFSGHIAVRSGK